MDDPALTRALAEKVMGWREHKEGSEYKDSESPAGTYLVVHGNVLRFDHDTWVEWRPLASMDDALMIMRHFEAAGCSAWVGCDGHTGRRGGVTTGAGRFEAEADTEARAVCYAALKSRGIEVPDGE